MRGNQDDKGVGWGACERSVCLTTRKISDSFTFRQLEKKKHLLTLTTMTSAKSRMT